MNFKQIFLFITFFFIIGCNQGNQNKKLIEFNGIQKYRNTGFALIYDDKFIKAKKISKKIDDRSLLIFHKSLKKNSFVIITNPINNKTVIAEVISNDVIF